MRIWLFDDQTFPSGSAAGRIRDRHPEHLKIYLAERRIDCQGPLASPSFRIRAWLDGHEQLVHEEHYRRYREHFGKTIAGFFTDEPRFGNAATYDAVLGRHAMVLPWSDDLLAELDGKFQVHREEFRGLLGPVRLLIGP